MKNKMRAAIFEGDGILTLKDIDIPKISTPKDILVKVDAASICGSDLHGLDVPPGQYMKPGIVYGHEFCGTIEEMGQNVSGFNIGDSVVINPRVRCGVCYECVKEKGDLCSNSYHYGQTGDGGFAQYALVEEKQVYKVPKYISPDILAQAEPLACVMSAIKVAKPTPMDYVLLYGAGPIGLTFIKVLKLMGVNNLIVTDRSKNRVEEARLLKTGVIVDTSINSLENEMKKHWPDKADLVFDAVGHGSVMSEATDMLNSRGRLILFGLNTHSLSKVKPSDFVLRELSVHGILGKEFPAAIELLKNKNLGLNQIISHRLLLDEIHEGFELLKKQEANRIIIYPNK